MHYKGRFDARYRIKLKGLYGALTKLIDNITSNAIRYTNDSNGIKIVFHVDTTHKDFCDLGITITDYGPGLPDGPFEILREKLGDRQCKRLCKVAQTPILSSATLVSPLFLSRRATPTRSPSPKTPDAGMAFSTEIGMPDIAFLGRKFGLSVETGKGKTSFKIAHRFDLVEALRHEVKSQDVLPPAAPRKIVMNLDLSALKVLVVDDERTNRLTLMRMLQKIGFKRTNLTEAEDGVDALGKIEGVDLLLTDKFMPTMGGAELTHNVKAMKDAPKVIMISGDESHDESLSKLLDAVVSKPVMILPLEKAIRSLYFDKKPKISSGIVSAFSRLHRASGPSVANSTPAL